jgi:hypothetical protein
MKEYLTPEIEITKAEANNVLEDSKEVVVDTSNMFGGIWG